jgi:guanyl-specific ribonuclease Sa
MKVGMDANQIAINQACGKAFSDQQMKYAPQWQRDLYGFTQGLDKILQPAVPLISVMGPAAAARGTAEFSAAKPLAVPEVKPLSPAVSQAVEGITAGKWPPAGNPGMKGGGTYRNADSKLPTDSGGTPISYQEWDVNPKTGATRDSERIVTGSDGSAWYTDDHYSTFVRVR